MNKRKTKTAVIRYPYRREFLSKAEMGDTMGQKNTMMDSSVLICDEQRFSADNIDTANSRPTSIIIKQIKEYNRSDTYRKTISKSS